MNIDAIEIDTGSHIYVSPVYLVDKIKPGTLAVVKKAYSDPTNSIAWKRDTNEIQNQEFSSTNTVNDDHCYEVSIFYSYQAICVKYRSLEFCGYWSCLEIYRNPFYCLNTHCCDYTLSYYDPYIASIQNNCGGYIM
ncbi:MAG: hypothetical protein ACPL1F_00955 [bacterium]